jgi:DNA invertase Pin-like site-specific DNA recombinase
MLCRTSTTLQQQQQQQQQWQHCATNKECCTCFSSNSAAADCSAGCYSSSLKIVLQAATAALWKLCRLLQRLFENNQQGVLHML